MFFNWPKIGMMILWYLLGFGITLLIFSFMGCSPKVSYQVGETKVTYDGGFLNDKEVAKLEVSIDPNTGLVNLSMEGYKTSEQMLGEIVKLLLSYQAGITVN